MEGGAFRRVAVVVVVVDSIAVEFVSTRRGASPCDNNHSHGGKFSLLERRGPCLADSLSAEMRNNPHNIVIVWMVSSNLHPRFLYHPYSEASPQTRM